mmetsp:Transcript_9895/g.9741  ORF Transcript_9895/g.9741 Transcript_9895/m.9741 type:complete len:90 (+) Transcript_9895:362-631(+)
MIDTGEFWNKLLEWKKKNYLMGASTHNSEEHSITTQGLIQGSIYTILDVFDCGETKLIHVKCPHGLTYEYSGIWNSDPKEWTEKMKKKV